MSLVLLGDCTPLMEAASGGYADIVSLLLDHGAEVNAKSAAGELGEKERECGLRMGREGRECGEWEGRERGAR